MQTQERSEFKWKKEKQIGQMLKRSLISSLRIGPRLEDKQEPALDS